MKENPNKSNQHRKPDAPTSHKGIDRKNVQPDSQKDDFSFQDRATTDIKQPDFANQPKRKTDPSKYTEEE